jgi:Sec-independent protein translocase protein TatA
VADSDELSDEQATRLVLRTVAALIAFVFAAGIVVVAQRSDEDDQDDVPVVESSEAATEFAGGSSAVGPLQGVELATYVRERRRALEDATGRRAAVVSFARYLTEDDADRLLGREDGVDVRSFLVAGPGGLPDAVDDLEDWAADQRRIARQEREELERLLPTVQDEEFTAQYRADIERLRRLESSVDAAAPVIFGAVVVADAEDLRAVAALDAVRLVDIALGAEVPDDDDARGIRPEETAEAGEPPSRPV